MSRTVQFVARYKPEGSDEELEYRGTADVEDNEPEGTLRQLLILLVQQLFAPIVVSVVDVLVEHWVRH